MLALTFLIISSIIGAGFATGAELISFFGSSGLHPLAIAILVGFFLFVNIFLIYTLDSRGHKPPPLLFAPIYFVFFIAMTAGIAQIAGIIASIVALALSIMIVVFGFDKLLFLNKFIMAFVLVTILIITIPNIHTTYITTTEPNISRALLSTIIYSGLNSCMLFPIFSKAQKKYNRKQIKIAIVLSVSIISFYIYLILSSISDGTAMPILALSNNFFVLSTIFLSIFTSQVIALFNISEATSSKKSNFIEKLILFSMITFILSLFGFSQIITYAYPAIAIFMIIYIFVALISSPKKTTSF